MRRAACRSRREHLVVVVVVVVVVTAVVVAVSAIRVNIHREYSRRRLTPIELQSSAPISRIAKEQRIPLKLRRSRDCRRTLAGTRVPCPLTDKEETTNAASARQRRFVFRQGFPLPLQSLLSDAIILGLGTEYEVRSNVHQ